MSRGSYIAEFFKHLFLWLILACTFLPLYLMLNISLKDNAQFARNPWFPEAPFHWENFISAWNFVGPNIFNTVFVAFTTTILAIAVALIGAYFFARYKMFGSTFLFYV